MKPFKVLPLILLVTIFFCGSVYAEKNEPIRTITVSGTGVLNVPANEASVSVGIETSHRDARAAEQQNSRIAKEIQDNLLRLGIKKDHIATNNYSFYPVYDNKSGKTTEITGYTVNNSITVKLTDLTKVSDVIDTSLHLGANKINSIRFSVQSTDELNQKALQLAVQNAKNKAQTMAASLNKRIVNVVSVTEHSASVTERKISSYALQSAQSYDAAAPIQAGNVNVSAFIEITFEIQ